MIMILCDQNFDSLVGLIMEQSLGTNVEFALTQFVSYCSAPKQPGLLTWRSVFPIAYPNASCSSMSWFFSGCSAFRKLIASRGDLLPLFTDILHFDQQSAW